MSKIFANPILSSYIYRRKYLYVDIKIIFKHSTTFPTENFTAMIMIISTESLNFIVGIQILNFYYKMGVWQKKNLENFNNA